MTYDLVRRRGSSARDRSAKVGAERQLHGRPRAIGRALRIVEFLSVSETSFSFGITSRSLSGVRTHV